MVYTTKISYYYCLIGDTDYQLNIEDNRAFYFSISGSPYIIIARGVTDRENAEHIKEIKDETPTS